MTSTRFFAAVFLLLLSLASESMAGDEPPAAPPLLTIGAAIPLTGDFAKFGVDIQRGMILAQEELRARSIPIAIKFEDTQYLPKTAVTVAQKLVDQDEVDVIVSLWDTAEAVAPIAERAKTPHFSIRWNPRVAEEFPHTFTFESTYITWVRELVAMVKHEGAKKVAVMTDTSAPGWVMARSSFGEQAAAAGLEIAVDAEVNGAGDDMNAAVSRLLATPSDYLVMLHYEPTVSDAFRKLGARGVKTPLTGYFEGLEEAPYLEGRRYPAQFDTQPWFYEKFAARYAGVKPIKAAFGYDLVMILGKLAEEKRATPSADEILSYLNRLKAYRGATGEISSNSSRNIETTCVVKEFRGGKAYVLPFFTRWQDAGAGRVTASEKGENGENGK